MECINLGTVTIKKEAVIAIGRISESMGLQGVAWRFPIFLAGQQIIFFEDKTRDRVRTTQERLLDKVFPGWREAEDLSAELSGVVDGEFKNINA